MSSRRKFIQSSFAMAATGLIPALPGTSAETTNSFPKKGKQLQMGMAGYTFLNYNIEQTISMMKRVGVDMLSLKEFHLPFDSSKEKAEEVVRKFKDGGITVYTVGVVYMKNTAEVDRTFDYASKVGVNMIIGVPEYELLQYTEQKVKDTGIKMAIHNHGPEDKRYPGPKDVYDRIKNMDARMGLCLDIGHAIRAGADPAKALTSYKNRIFDLHIKDVSAAVREGKAMEVGRGVIDFSALVKALNKINYQGKCSIEFEKDMKDPLPGIAESVGYFRGVMNAV